jgi:septal ring factor EnvC (AmiA/AmiB activator)
MSDPKQNAALTTRDVSHIVEAAGTHSLISASVLSSRVITEATAYFERSAKALERILSTLEGKDAHGAHKPMAVTAALDAASAKSIADTLSTSIQPQLDKHSEMLGNLLAQLGDLAQAAAESEQTIATVLLGEEGHIRRLESSIAENQEAVASVLLGEEGHIRRLGRELGELTRRVARLEEQGGAYTAPPPDGAAADQAREMREAQDALRDRVTAMEGSIRELLARGPEGGGPPRSTRRS